MKWIQGHSVQICMTGKTFFAKTAVANDKGLRLSDAQLSPPEILKHKTNRIWENIITFNIMSWLYVNQSTELQNSLI